MARSRQRPLLNTAGPSAASASVDASTKAAFETWKARNIKDLEAHCARQQALLSQTQLALEYVTAENEQLRLALSPAIDPEPIRISVQTDQTGRSAELQLWPADNTDAVVRAFCRQHGLQGERAQRVRMSAERAVGTLRATGAAAA